MHYYKSKGLQILNALFEMVLLIIAFFVSGFIRLFTPIGDTFFFQDILLYFPTAIIYAVVIAAIYYLFGAYKRLDYGKNDDVLDELIRSCIIHLLGVTVVATILYSFHLLQFSRLLLALYYTCTVLIINLKRYIVFCFAEAYRKRHQITRKAVVVGDGKNATRYFHDVLSKDDSIQYCGYVSETDKEILPKWLGTDIQKALLDSCSDTVIYAPDVQSLDEIKRVTYLAHSYGITVIVVSVYSGLRLFDYKEYKKAGFMRMTIQGVLEESNQTQVGQKLSKDGLINILENYEQNKGKVFRYDNIEDLGNILGCNPNLTHYFLCDSAAESSELLNRIDKKLKVVGIGYHVFCTDELNNNEKMNSWIQNSKADIVWVLLNTDMQEKWLAINQGRIDSVVIGIGKNVNMEQKKRTINAAYIWKQLKY